MADLTFALCRPGIDAIDERLIVSPQGAMRLEKVPGHMVILGAGVIGHELGSLWGRLGAKVTVVDTKSRLHGMGLYDTFGAISLFERARLLWYEVVSVTRCVSSMHLL